MSNPHVTRLTLEYDGREFAGWATQPGRRTIQQELERALAVVLRRPVTVTVAGRTDAGVHALAQVASYVGEPVPAHKLNALLPDDVAVLDARPALPGFSARHDATSRAYRYRLLTRRSRSAHERGRALHWSHPLDRDALDGCAAALVGTHDFTAFTPTSSAHVLFQREVCAAAWRTDGDLLIFEIEADAFMRNMNRVLIGTMLEVGGGQRPLDDFEALLEGAPRSRAGKTAPPHGLYLVGVGYDGRRVLPIR
ncbi:tRNA pseudouridine(38-40) synthase TruA [Conexibacter stalactiti]|uniref:tRNA pseudouridine synthase A n=1 Tax=Conexibacter stalactiti TaxID=1940611 RepID=A0ABU4HU19_9ACTN|nr:tRNA pseudouridine(38-40) synthase TruA [Conexibacter stalactiti]MDW5596030.1 tRNA pseudouridine(38-40) synthase TruA [Conexibacter stalactiti]MEC5036672.1 tRNA pseudouridine(38-40) synthase TruA [Conexibacter stalactiti]